MAVTPTSWSCFFGTGLSYKQDKANFSQQALDHHFCWRAGQSGEATYLEKAINDCNGHVHGLLQQPKLDLDLDEPINEDGTHVPSDFSSFQIPWLDSLISLREMRLK